MHAQHRTAPGRNSLIVNYLIWQPDLNALYSMVLSTLTLQHVSLLGVWQILLIAVHPFSVEHLPIQSPFSKSVPSQGILDILLYPGNILDQNIGNIADMLLQDARLIWF